MNLRLPFYLLLASAVTLLAEPAKSDAKNKDKAKPADKEAAAEPTSESKPTDTKPAEATPLAAPEAEASMDPVRNIAEFFAALAKKDIDGAYDRLTKGTKIAERAEDVKTLKSKTKDAIAVFGGMKGHEIVATQKVGERLLSLTCVSLGQDFPLRWRFYYYKPEDQWKLIDLRVDDRLASIFDEPDAARPRDEKRE